MSAGGFCIDYGKRQCGCKKCKQKIEKGEVRIAKITANPFSDEGVMKNYHHPACIFQTFLNARATTKIIEDPGDLDGWSDVKSEDQKTILALMKDTLSQVEAKRSGTPNKKKSPATKDKQVINKGKKRLDTDDTSSQSPEPKRQKIESKENEPNSTETEDLQTNGHPDDSFKQFHKICQKIRDHPSYLAKTELLAKFFKHGTSKAFQGDLLLWVRLLIPGVVKRVYHMQSKQMIKIFSRIFETFEEDMLEDLEQGDVAETISKFFTKSKSSKPQENSELSLQQVDFYLNKLSGMTKEEEQQHWLEKVTKRCTAEDLKMFIRLIKGDLRIQSGPKHILEALHPEANDAFNSSRNIENVIERILHLKEIGNPHGKLDVGASLMQPVQPMLAAPCKSVDAAFQKCPNGIFSEIKYDGERVQVHKKGSEFRYFSRSLKPVMAHKVKHFKEFIPKAFPEAVDLILDAEVLLVDNKTGNPLPFGTLGIHKGSDFKDADPCLFIFDCIFYNGENLMNKTLKERRRFLTDTMVEVGNRIKFSEIKEIKKKDELVEMIKDTFRKGLEGLMIKDKNSIYEPGKRHWLKVKKDYLNEGAMADSADLVVLGGWYGSGQKGGLISIFLMGCQDPITKKWCTVSKVHTGHDDATLDKLQGELAPNMEKIKGDHSKVPSWLKVNRGMVPDFVAVDPLNSPVWEITGAEFSKAELHTARGISIRFPRVTRIRDDKTPKTATNLNELEDLYNASKQHLDVDLGPDCKTEEVDSPSKKKIKIEQHGSEDTSSPKKKKVENKQDPSSPNPKIEKEENTGYRLTERVGDLFSCPRTSSLAHCISRDCRLGKGIAKIFREKFGRIKEIESCKAGIGDVATLKDKDRYIYNLVTKERYSDKPTYESLRKCLVKMKEHASDQGVTQICMPRIGCGLDGLQWPAVKTLLKNVFMNENVSIVVYSLDDSENKSSSGVSSKTSTSSPSKTSDKKQTSMKEFFSSKNKESSSKLERSEEKTSANGKLSNGDIPEKRTKDQKPESSDKRKRDAESESSEKKRRRVDIGHGFKVLNPLPDLFKHLKIHISASCPDYDLLRRTVIGYGGSVVSDTDQDLTHLVYNGGDRVLGQTDTQHVSYKWLEDSIKLEKLQPEKYYQHV